MLVIVSSLLFYLVIQSREFDRNVSNFAQNNIQEPDRRKRFIQRSTAVEKTTLFSVTPEDVGMFILTIIISYLMAGVTLRPIKKSMEIQKQFLANASHELRTPLAIMKTELEVFLRGKNNLSQSKQVLLRRRTDMLSNIEEIDKMEQIINNLLFLSRADSYEENFHFSKVSISSLMSDISKRINGVAKRKRISLHLKLDKISVFADSIRLEQAILNIITNAIKYTKEGGRVSILAKKNDEYIIISVMDNGIGISKKDLPHIFEPFYRSKSVEVNKAEGVGLGLHIASVIIKRHGGKIGVKSTLGKGTTIHVFLPLNRAS